ncbi:ABC transporter ATP-binding protein [Marinilactibacillus kalidii]|uniref:ABC transporter ATP-binding protein n=1 Tax=Marinilactibacillus kalidii TaxID=2820274 RepID=UPI001ABE9ECC|nr:ABC transporter ATP-binding protein [Marinilactibacillus kalidii]
MSLLTLNKVSKTFGNNSVLDNVDLAIPKGSIYGFIGVNGAGKTTTMKLILGLEEISSGEIKIDGEVVTFGQTKTNRFTGYLPDVPDFYGFMTAREYLKLCGEITGIPKKHLANKIGEMFKKVGLEDNKKQIKTYSRGMKQRLGVAQALLNEPKLLICDEPTSALDPNGRREFLTLIASLKKEMTIIFSTHILDDVERICDQVCILHNSKIVAHGSLTVLKQQYAQEQIEIQVEKKDDTLFTNLLDQLIKEEKIQAYTKKETAYVVNYTQPYLAVTHTLFAKCEQKDIAPTLLRKVAPSLEQIFLEVTA